MGNLTTTNLGLPKPVSTNPLSTDVERIRTTFDGFDTSAAAAAAHVASTSNPHSTTATQVGAIADGAGVIDDTRLGSRTADPTQVPSGLSGTATQWVSWLTNRIRAITGATNWYDAPAITLAAAKTHTTSTTNPHSTTAAQVGAIADGAGVVDDTRIGNRTADPTLNPGGLTGSLTQWLSWITNRFRSINGTSNWYDAPPVTLAAAAAHQANTSNPHAVTAAQVGAPTTAGTGANGTWNISVTGSATAAPWSGITGKPTTVAGYGITDKEKSAITVVTANMTLVANSATYILSGSGMTLTLPGSPTAGDTIPFDNLASTSNAFARNGSKIMGLLENLTFDLAYRGGKLVYVDSNWGWVVIL